MATENESLVGDDDIGPTTTQGLKGSQERKRKRAELKNSSATTQKPDGGDAVPLADATLDEAIESKRRTTRQRKPPKKRQRGRNFKQDAGAISQEADAMPPATLPAATGKVCPDDANSPDKPRNRRV